MKNTKIENARDVLEKWKDDLDQDLGAELDMASQDPELQLKDGVAKLKEMSDYRSVLKIAINVRESAKKVNSLLKSDNGYNQALEILKGPLQVTVEEDLYHIKSDSTISPRTQNLAFKTIQYFNLEIRGKIQNQLAPKLSKILEKLEWPKKTLKIERGRELDSQFVSIFRNYLETESPRSDILSVFKTLADPIDLRFRFHFEGSAVTNRPDKPEWAFHHFLTIIDSHFEFLAGTVTKLLQENERFQDRNGVYEFISAIIPSVQRKMFGLFEELLESPKLLSHLVYETVLFDNALKEKYFYLPHNQKIWKGVAGSILGNKDWFQRWLSVESESALLRYVQIESSSNAFDIDYDAIDPSETAPTISAVNLRDLLLTITEHYAWLTSVRFRLRYFLDVQVYLLDKYYGRLLESLEAFESMTSGFTRAVGGISKEDAKLVSGVNGLERLCKIYGSLNYISYCLEQWGDEEVSV